MTWTHKPPRAQGKYLIVEKPWRHVTVGFYCPIMAHPWEIAGRWYDLDVVECWQELPSVPNAPQ